MPDITMTNFPPSGGTLEMRTIVVGPRGPMRLIMDVDANEAGDDFAIDLTVSNAAEHDELKAFLTDMIELLQAIVEETDFETSLVKALEQKQAEIDNAEETVTDDPYYPYYEVPADEDDE